ncbi:MAG: type II toxin-antitoxin system RelE/ParE family toxin [Gammaproteobacteria bacterium]|nr:type II toxin-antitoxin system RelE/ParE family toxin [Gammaproteobacteria bacterium]
MNSFFVSKAAKTDLKNIAAYTQKSWGEGQRRTYIKELDVTFHFLAENPTSGVSCNYIANKLRKHHHKHHTIFYENVGESILIIRILHKSMDVELQPKEP